MNAISLNSSLRQCTLLLGPAVGGLLVASIGPGWTYLLDAFLFIPLMVGLTLLRVPGRVANPSTQPPLQSLKESIRYVSGRPELLALFALIVVPTVLVGASINALMPAFADGVLGVGVQGYGFMLSASGLGAIVGAVGLAYLGDLRAKGVWALASILAYGVLLVVLSLTQSYLLVLVVFVGLGALFVSFNSLTTTLVQVASPDHVRGRVMGLHSMASLGLQIFNGPALGGLAAALGVAAAFGLVGAVIGLVTVAFVLAVPTLRRL